MSAKYAAVAIAWRTETKLRSLLGASSPLHSLCQQNNETNTQLSG
ncbi:MAG: hypothetical protein V7K25_13880 [Nostoc sp.]